MEILHGPHPLPKRLIDSRRIHPLANAIRRHLRGTEVDILPIVMSRTGTPHSSTITSLTSLLTLRTDPSDKLISKARLDTSRIIAQLSNGCIISYSYYTASSPAQPLAAPPHTAPTHPLNCTPCIAHSTMHRTLPGGELKPPSPFGEVGLRLLAV
jgi:hypothetical protein